MPDAFGVAPASCDPPRILRTALPLRTPCITHINSTASNRLRNEKLVNTLTLPRSESHPPDTQDLTVLEISVPADRRELALTDRLSLRLGLWLLLRAQRAQSRAERRAERVEELGLLLLEEQNRLPLERYALLTYDLQRQLR